MTTPPRRDEEDLLVTLRRIRRRRRQVGDDSVDMVGNSALEMWHYLRKHSGPDMPAWVLQAEVKDVMRLRVCLAWEIDRMELWVWDSGERHGVHHLDIGVEVGVKSRSGCRLRHDRKIALLREEDGRPDHMIARRARNPTNADLVHERTVTRWLRTHRVPLRLICQEMMEFEPAVDDDTADLLRNLWRDFIHPEQYTPALIGTITLVVGALQTMPTVEAIDDPQHPLLRAFARWEQLYAEWLAMSKKADRARGEADGEAR